MFIYMLFFAAGYYLGSGGKLPPRPQIRTTADGSLIISPPADTNTTLQPTATPSTYPSRGGWQLPAGWSIDGQGNVFDAQGRLYANAGQAAQW